MKRNTDLDFIRAILIILMILIHIVSFGNAYPHLKAGILSFMMPTFLIITGYLVNIGKTGRQFGKYLLCLALPYVIMVTGFSVLSYFLPVRDGITELSLSQIAQKIFVTSIGPYWFIQTMIICGILYYGSFRACDMISKYWGRGSCRNNKENDFCSNSKEIEPCCNSKEIEPCRNSEENGFYSSKKNEFYRNNKENEPYRNSKGNDSCSNINKGKTEDETLSLTTRLFLLAILMLLVSKTPALNITAAIYYFAGVVIRQCRIDFNKVFRPTPLAFILWPFILYREDLYDWGNMAIAFSCWCCISALMWLNQYYKSQLVGKSTLLYIGKNTLPIYLFHPIFTMAAKFYHPLFAFDKSEILLAAFTIILAIAGSIAIAKVMEKTKLAYFFGKKEILR